MLKEIPQVKQASVFDTCFRNALLTNKKVALWRLPNQTVKQVAIDFGNDLLNIPFNFESSVPGFAINPFYSGESGKLFFIKADIFFDDLHAPEEQSDWKKYIEYISNSNIESGNDHISLPGNGATSSENDHEHYIAIIEKALAGIKEDDFKKVVVARTKLVETVLEIDPLALFDKLCAKYGSAFVSLIHHPGFGCWIGATPETLASLDGNMNFRTIALAGTQKINKEKDLSQITWNHKEIEEQAYVNRYISSCFKTLGIKDYEEYGPRTIAAGNLAHLRTDFSVNMAKSKMSSAGTKMLELLHPTSAVCGMPKQSSMDFIFANENIDRSLYSGFLGPVNIKGQSHIFVNIRCAKLFKNAALLYAGAGITKESDPEKEWLETEMKMNTIQNVLTS